MKKLLLTLVFIFTLFSVFSQVTYQSVKNIILEDGYKVSSEQIVSLSQDSHGFYYKTFYAGNAYKVFALSENKEVIDLDILIYDLDGNLLLSDSDNSSIGFLEFTCDQTITVKVIVFNYKSSNSYVEYPIKLFIGYK